VVTDTLAQLGRRERKKRQTRAALEQAALRLFAEKGYDQTTVEDIADAADVAVRTFFRYFQSKQHILFGDFAHQIAARLAGMLAGRPAGEPVLVSVRAVLDAIEPAPGEEQEIMLRLRMMEERPALMGTYLTVMEQMHCAVAEFVGERVGRAPEDFYPQMVAAAAVAAAKYAVLGRRGSRDRAALRAMRRAAFDRLTAGLGTP